MAPTKAQWQERQRSHWNKMILRLMRRTYYSTAFKTATLAWCGIQGKKVLSMWMSRKTTDNPWSPSTPLWPLQELESVSKKTDAEWRESALLCKNQLQQQHHVAAMCSHISRLIRSSCSYGKYPEIGNKPLCIEQSTKNLLFERASKT